MADWLRRFLEAQGYSVAHVKNITDVGHMRQDVLERGEDKVIAAALAEGKSPQEIAQFYTDAFLRDEAKLNISPAHEFPRATDNVPEMADLTKTLIDSKHAYEVQGNVYFDVASFPQYGKLSGQQAAGLEEGARVETDPLKRDQRDFALWKAAEPGRLLKWPSPWGEGFPGWHIECSAMVAKYLGPEIDFHTGGVDNIFPHHEDEIAQSEAVLGRQHVHCWLHGQHLLVDGLKMAKSTGNTYLISDIEHRGFDAMAFRYLCATAHFRSRLNFTLPSLRAAQRGLTRLRQTMHEVDGRVTKKATIEAEKLRDNFWSTAADGLNIPAALAVAWRVARSRLAGGLKRELLMDFDRLLGLDLVSREHVPEMPGAVVDLVKVRDALRRQSLETDRRSGLCPGEGRDGGQDARADAIRDEVRAMGYEVRDTPAGTQLLPAPAWAKDEGTISSSRDVDSLLQEPPEFDFTISIVARQGCLELERCLTSVRASLGNARAEIIIVDNGFEDDCGSVIDGIACSDERLRVFHADHFLGSAAARNVSLRQARGRCVLFIDTSVELKGDIFSGLSRHLADATVGIVGRWGVITNDIRSFTESTAGGDVHAVEGYLMAFRREVLREVGFLDEKYRFYRHLDLDFSFALRSKGYRALIDIGLPVIRHEHIDWSLTPEDERERLSKRNFYRFLHKWGERTDLLVTGARSL
jgi:cysteinyl-tRNA synthetase